MNNIEFNNILIANIIAFIGSMIMALSGLVKDSKKFLIYQNVHLLIFAISNVLLSGYTGAVLNLVSIIRNFLCYKNKLSKITRLIILLIQITGCLIVNNLGLIGLFPLISAVLNTILLTTDAKKLKILTAGTMVLWVIYDFYIQSYTTFAFDIFAMCTNLFGLYKIYKQNKIEYKK